MKAISRRRFLAAVGATSAHSALPTLARAGQLASADDSLLWPPNRTLPSFRRPASLSVSDATALSSDEQILLVTLQGIVNRTRPRMYLLLSADDTDQLWLDTTQVPYRVSSDPLSLIGQYHAEAAGAVIYDPDVPDTINVATSLAGIMRGVATTAELAGEYGYPILTDLRGCFADKIAAYSWLLDNYWSRLTPRLLAGISPQTASLRDYIVATRCLVFWLDPQAPAESDLFARILQRVTPNTPYLGWFVAGNEAAGVTLCSQHGVMVGAADDLDNATVLGGVDAPIRPFQSGAPPQPPQNKIYLTLTMSDGDNLQFDQHRLRAIWDDPARGSVPINWSISSLLRDIAPIMLQYYQRTRTPNDLLVAGPSGLGYMYPVSWPTAALAAFTRRSGEYMAAAGMNVLYALNRLNGANVDFTTAIATEYADHIALLGMLGNVTETAPGGGYLTFPAGLPVITQAGIGNVAQGRAVLAAAAQSWDGTRPLFLALLASAWSMTPADLNSLVAPLGVEFEVVRADALFGMVRQTPQ